jgi:SAM-dependent methyltransferase
VNAVATERERLAAGFDDVAHEYARHRPTYPDELVDAACAAGGLGPGSRVLEVGCGTGQLTRSLLARGLAVDAIDASANMIRVARETVDGAVRFHVGRFEEVDLPAGTFDAVFSASAFHWVDPAVGWARAATLLRPGGLLALLQYVSARDERSAAAEEALLDALARVAPEVAAGWPRPRDPAALAAGVQERRGNVSDVWAFVGQHDVANPDAAGLFTDAALTTFAVTEERSAAEVSALLRTTSLVGRLGPERLAALEAENRRVLERFGGRLRLTSLAALVTAARWT